MELLLIASLLAVGQVQMAKDASKYAVRKHGFDVELKQIRDRHFSKDQQQLLGYALAVHKISVEHKVTFRWEFP